MVRGFTLAAVLVAAGLAAPVTAVAADARDSPWRRCSSRRSVALDGPFVRITVRARRRCRQRPTPTAEGPPRVFIDLPGVSPGRCRPR